MSPFAEQLADQANLPGPHDLEMDNNSPQVHDRSEEEGSEEDKSDDTDEEETERTKPKKSKGKRQSEI